MEGFPQVRINGKGHLLCLSRILQSSLEEETFADVQLVVFNSNSFSGPDTYDRPPCLRANRAVLAAASPLFALLLKERTEDDIETTLVFEGYHNQDITNMLEYIYTGQSTIKKKEELAFQQLLDYMQIGRNATDCMKLFTQQPIQIPIRDDPHIQPKKTMNNDIYIGNQKLYAPLSSFKLKTKHQRKMPVYPARPLELPKAEITLEDPQIEDLQIMRNPDELRANVSIIEKSSIKFDLLSKLNMDPTGNLMDYPRMADRLGIYFDPQLFSYYRSLVRALPPIRIFLNIDDDVPCNDGFEKTEKSLVKKSDIVYPPAQESKIIQRIRRQRKSFLSSRIPVKTLCCVNGKTHVTLDGQLIPIDSSIKEIDYPSFGSEKECEFSEIQQETNDGYLQRNNNQENRRTQFTTLKRPKTNHLRSNNGSKQIQENLPIHLNTEESSDQSKKRPQRLVVCEICGKLISASWIRVHFANHKGEKNYLCEHCGRSFASANLLKSHVHYQHNSQLDMFQCSVCDKSFTKKSRLEIHMRIHSDTRPYRCSVSECGKRFHTKGNLRKHSFVHSEERPHKCDVCSKSFTQLIYLRLHKRTHQKPLLNQNDKSRPRLRKPETIYSCEFCPMTFSRTRHFNAHRASHTGELTKLPCTSCQQHFNDINELKQHKRMEHPNTVHQCPMCDKVFFKKTAMQRHQASHTEDQFPKRNFPCQYCNTQYTTAAARIVHERTHTGERPFKCPTCSKTFTSKYNFRQHLRMHSDERPFKCSQCDKAYRQPQHLRAHAFIHKDEDESVPCPICGKVFRNKILLLSHKRIHKQIKVNASSNIQENVLADEEPGQQFVDNNIGFVNIIVLTDNTEQQ